MKYHHPVLVSWLAGVLLLTLPLVGLAHKPSDSYLSLYVDTENMYGQWDIALRDLEYALGLDANQDGAITWGELRARHSAIAAYALARLSLHAGSDPCVLSPVEQLVDNHSDGAYTVLRFAVNCPDWDDSLRLDYRLFFDLDPSHRGLVRIQSANEVQAAVLSPEQDSIELNPHTRSRWRQFSEYWREGLWHIWIGFDHILFLIALLLPAVLWREGGHWREVKSFQAALINVLGIVTAFTLAHSLTLSVAALGWFGLPSRWVESTIAATVLLAALNNLLPLVQGRRWLIALCSGLIHGFGFASVLMDLGLPSSALILSLVGFNVGVETGQLAIVAVFLPIAFGLRRSWFYRQVVFKLGSTIVAIIALVWLLERSLDVCLVSL